MAKQTEHKEVSIFLDLLDKTTKIASYIVLLVDIQKYVLIEYARSLPRKKKKAIMKLLKNKAHFKF